MVATDARAAFVQQAMGRMAPDKQAIFQAVLGGDMSRIPDLLNGHPQAAMLAPLIQAKLSKAQAPPAPQHNPSSSSVDRRFQEALNQRFNQQDARSAVALQEAQRVGAELVETKAMLAQTMALLDDTRRQLVDVNAKLKTLPKEMADYLTRPGNPTDPT